MRKHMPFLVALVAAMLFAVPAGASASDPLCSTPGEDCSFLDAGYTQAKSTKGSSTSSTVTNTNTVTTESIRTYESITKTKVVFYWASTGLKITASTKCVDPVRKGWIRVGEVFKNTYKDANGRKVIKYTRWKRGDLLCNYRKVGSGKNERVRGTIRRCKNKDVEIFLNRELTRKADKVTEFKSKGDFQEKTTSSSGTSTTPPVTTTLPCPAGMEDAGTECLGPKVYFCVRGNLVQMPNGAWKCKVCRPVTGSTPCPPPERPSCQYLNNPEHVYPGMSRWIDLSCTANTFQVNVDNAMEWRGFVTFVERTPLSDGKVKWRFKYTAPATWGGDVDSGNFFPVAADGTTGASVPVSVQTPKEDFGP